MAARMLVNCSKFLGVGGYRKGIPVRKESPGTRWVLPQLRPPWDVDSQEKCF